jgi:hypothetical protein
VPLTAAPAQPIGLAAGESTFTVGSSAVEGQATLFEGDTVRSMYLATRLHTRDGMKYVLGIDSEGVIYRDRLVLKSGSVDVANSGKPGHVDVGLIHVVADQPGTQATVYVTANNRASVMVRSGAVKVAPTGAAKPTLISKGEVVSFQFGPNRSVKLDADNAVADVNRIQSEQVALLMEASRSFTCLSPAAETMSRSFGNLSSQLAVNQAARSSLLTRVNMGIATPADTQTLANLNGGLRSLGVASSAIAADLDNVIYQFHHPGPGPSNPSDHSIHGHTAPQHHGQHGHTITVDDIGGHHHVPPHAPTG